MSSWKMCRRKTREGGGGRGTEVFGPDVVDAGRGGGGAC